MKSEHSAVASDSYSYIQHDFAYVSYCVSANGTVFSYTWPRLEKNMIR